MPLVDPIKHFGRTIRIEQANGFIAFGVYSRNKDLIASGHVYDNNLETAIRRAKMAAEVHAAPSYKG